MSTQTQVELPVPIPPKPGSKTQSFLLWAFGISLAVHLAAGVIYPYATRPHYEEESEKITLIKKKTAIPTPPPTPPPPTPKPKVQPTIPPPKLKLNVVKTTNKGEASGPTEQRYVPPPVGNEEVKGNVVSTAAPVVTSGPATAAPTAPPPPPPTPTPRACAQPHADAVMTQGVEPEYPEIARQQGAVGVTQVKVDLDPKGNVVGASVYKSSGSPILDREAMKAARASRYRAEVENCVAVGGSYLFRAEFQTQ